MSYPEYETLADALLIYIFQHGGNTYECNASDTYEPLADIFGLSHTERTAPRADGHSGRQWENLVQWTRQRLINDGYAESRSWGVWGLTSRGVSRARSLCP
jgi:hypothetical protein